ncbi:hypothetical protein L1887_48822 [Cichorium endivia]|nr:hypothetical protein L1887_48822 [Cichorium endivia]
MPSASCCRANPYKVHKKTATIRFMFFNPEDVYWFKPITLHTKLGPHGAHHRVARHARLLQGALLTVPSARWTTVLMNLYKRVYPKWAQPFGSAYDELPLPRSEVYKEDDVQT